ncbi:MAG: rhomboid family intramembrane serine protease [Aeromicrobium sp.]|uniref:rhomboid family intramembrane serine protease n=1 Tax=Aeromicrobium sp. TaxID=1871063 RepID=UPI0039E42D3E
MSVCYRHTGREAYIACQRCDRSICPECMREAAVGFQCPECVSSGAKAVRQPRTVAGGALPGHAGVATLALIGVNVTIFVLTDLLGLRDLEVYGSLVGDLVVYDDHLIDGVAGGEYWRLVTSAFLHVGVLHLAFNMLALYLFGPFLENVLGTVRFAVFYLAAALFSGAVVYWLSGPHTVTVGASGAVFALFGLALVVLLKAGQDVRTLIVLLAINAVMSLQGGISWQGHLGGFVAGVLFGLALVVVPPRRGALAQGLGVLLLVAVAAGIVVLRTASLTV